MVDFLDASSGTVGLLFVEVDAACYGGGDGRRLGRHFRGAVERGKEVIFK